MGKGRYLKIHSYGLFGYTNGNGDVVIPCEYVEIGEFRHGFVRCQNRQGEVGYFDKNGKIIVPFEYVDGGEFENGYVWCRNKQGKVGYLNRDGKTIVPFEYDEGENFRYGMAPVCKDGKWGFVDEKGNEVIAPKYDGALQPEMHFNSKKPYARVFINGKTGAITKAGECVPCEYQGVFPAGVPDVWLVWNNRYRYGLVEKGGKVLLPTIYPLLSYIGNKCFEAIKPDDISSHGIIDLQGNELFPFKYKRVSRVDGVRSLFILEDKNKKLGLINNKCEVILPCMYSVIERVPAIPNLLRIRKSRSYYGLITYTGEELLPCIYNEIINDYTSELTEEKIFSLQLSVKKKGSYGLYDLGRQQMVVKCIYDDQIYFTNSYAVVVRNEKMGIIDADGNEVVPCEYDFVKHFDNVTGEVIMIKDRKDIHLSVKVQ